MRVLAITDGRYLKATRRVVGDADLLVSPPLAAADITADCLEGYDVIYIDLHGIPSSAFLYNSLGTAAVSLAPVRAAHLAGAVVISPACYLPESPFLEALRRAGADVIAGTGPNWGTRKRISGAQVLARYVMDALRRGADAEAALDEAKARLGRSPRRLFDRKATRDALEFKLYRSA